MIALQIAGWLVAAWVIRGLVTAICLAAMKIESELKAGSAEVKR